MLLYPMHVWDAQKAMAQVWLPQKSCGTFPGSEFHGLDGLTFDGEGLLYIECRVFTSLGTFLSTFSRLKCKDFQAATSSVGIIEHLCVFHGSSVHIREIFYQNVEVGL